ncbi:MAG: tandem-95 repeat protein [Deltaproteobacteria bacterium]|nr:tandem-95 repeat protein [Deltaproteobacteria bacterium]
MSSSRRAALVTIALAACDAAAPVEHAPIAADVMVTTVEDTPVRVSLPGVDPDGDRLRWTVTAPAHGSLTGPAPALTYAPALDFAGDDAVMVTVADGERVATARIAIVVSPAEDAPVANPDAVDGTEDVAQVIPAATLLANDTDVDGDALAIIEVGAAHGGDVALVGGDVTFTPATDQTAPAGFSYTISDGARTATAEVTVALAAVNDPPIAVGDSLSVAEDSPLVVGTVTLLANDPDPDGDALEVVAVGGEVGGTAELRTTAVWFTPTPDRTGPASFTYTISDGALTAVGTVAVTIVAVDDPPVAIDDATATGVDTPLVLDAAVLVANDTDIEGDPLMITAVGAAVGGTVALVGTTITFTPDASFTGAAQFDYTVSDGQLADAGTVVISVE